MLDEVINNGIGLKRLVLALALIAISLGCQANAAGLEAAMDAMAKGDYGQGVTILRPLAKRGDVEAQYLLGKAYSHGSGVDTDPAKAIKWLERAAEKMHYGAATTLGKLYASGMGVKISTDLAAKWFALAADIAKAMGEIPKDCSE